MSTVFGQTIYQGEWNSLSSYSYIAGAQQDVVLYTPTNVLYYTIAVPLNDGTAPPFDSAYAVMYETDGSVSNLPVSTYSTTTLGISQADGYSIVDNNAGVYSVPAATSTSLGLIKPDGTTVTITEGGVTWTQSASDTTDFINSLYYANGTWAGTSDNNGIWYSTDNAVTWTLASSTNGINFIQLYYANGTWVAGSNNNNGIWYSTDNAITWTQSVSDNTDVINTVYYANNTWVMSSGNGNGIWYSTDNAVTWTQSVSFTTDSVQVFYYANETFVAASDQGIGIWYSTDNAVTWIQSVSFTTISFISLYYANGTWVAGSASSTGLYYSTDNGVTWTQSVSNNTDSIQSLYYANGTWVAGSAGNNSGIWYSTDNAVTWINSISDNTDSFQCIYYANGTWIAGSVNGNGIWYSTDNAVTWTQSADLISTTIISLYYANGVWVVGTSFNGFWYSTVGVLSINSTNPMTTLGDTIYGGISGVETRLIGNSTSTIERLSSTGSGGSATAPIWSQVNFTELAGNATIAQGGTNTTSITGKQIMISNSGADAIVEAGVMTNGQLLIGSTSGLPVVATITGTANQVAVTNGNGTITVSLPQDIATTSSPTFNTMLLSGAITLNNQAATKAYVDAASQGLTVLTPCTCVSTSNIALTGLFTIDGYSVQANDRVLVTDQTSNINNGIYVASAGAWTRSSDFNSGDKLNNYTLVQNGTSYKNTGWICTTGSNVGTTPTLFTEFSSPVNYLAGAGLSLTGQTFAVIPATNSTIGGVIVDASTGFITVNGSGNISIPQSVALNATPTFASEFLSANTNQLVLGTTNTTTVTMTTLTGNRTLTLPNANSNTIRPLGSATASNWVQYIDSTGLQNLAQPTFEDIDGIVSVIQGGTGQTTYTDGQLLIGNSNDNSLSVATITGTANQVVVANGNGSITLSLPQDIATTSSPTFTAVSATNFNGNLSGIAEQTYYVRPNNMSDNSTYYLALLNSDTSPVQPVDVASNFSVNPSTGIFTATSFSGITGVTLVTDPTQGSANSTAINTALANINSRVTVSSFRNVTVNPTLTNSDSIVVLGANNLVATLPLGSTCAPGQQFTIIQSAFTGCSVSVQSSDTINGSLSTFSLTDSYFTLTVVWCDTAGWIIC